MSHIALIGASGDAGSRILKELSDRGHTVTAIARHPEKIVSLPNVTAKQGDALDKDALVALFKGHDAVVSAVKFGSSDPAILIAAVKTAGVKRYLVVGGAGSLEIAPGQRLIDQPDFPDAYRPEASRGAAFLDLLKQEKDLDWSFLSPSAEFVPGQRTGTFRLGKDTLLSNDQGSSISFEDYAVALVDEIENPAHSRQRFTVGY
ncbi:3-beta hydroxysteroid dehydrogenase [Pectobacterium brasiliense]|uniref:NAD(P)-dependent oxidoreductase n=1 Tax=Pectobacterium TaxID=122277 RepID=UPI00057ED585|nr:NAD(P)-dependent oxidoreductase [Pectobacterium brasiliense]KHS90970.1 3-beta hydroxysteroid dehydrogenase [Pectobacterium brasiliense]MBN3069872.1 NAD(P)-dependent oxidoreductase [Pectobacterium brasiliense]MBN3161883.1 NAD(P)-dependent oxidoreductase [Pectobacterium brasiliense]MBN3246920.1 NAD(P)-dependent oxidoreductase [Pectobacterium brasiliense]MBN3341574.1 NAD(P)-dependent oxidoreductase [Pectobacterium brasiliense]